jgi:hypothetical protein
MKLGVVCTKSPPLPQFKLSDHAVHITDSWLTFLHERVTRNLQGNALRKHLKGRTESLMTSTHNFKHPVLKFPTNRRLNYRFFCFFYLWGRRKPAYRISGSETGCTLTPVLFPSFISRGAPRQTA